MCSLGKQVGTLSNAWPVLCGGVEEEEGGYKSLNTGGISKNN